MIDLSSPSSRIVALAAIGGAVAASLLLAWLGASPFAVTALLLPALAGIGILISSNLRLSRRLKLAADTLKALQHGDFERRICDVTETGQIGDLLWSINDFADGVDSFVREAQASLAAVTNGLYYRRVLEVGMHGTFRRGATTINTATTTTERKVAAFGGATSRFERAAADAISKVGSASETLQQTALTLNKVAGTTNQRSASVAAASEQASASLRSVVCATEELRSSSGEINQQVRRSAEVSGTLLQHTTVANREVDGLVAAAGKIGEVVNLIKDIASQTNLLALNATIEAARAGEVGKGFAVVASEVKNLATQTGRATDDIIAQVDAIQASVQAVAKSIRDSGDVIREMNESAATIAASMEQQSAATAQIAQNVEQASAGSNEVAHNIVEVRQAAAETEDSARTLVGSVDSLRQQSDSLTSELGRFLGELKQVI
jgi:methyl-accepting chemotaxis protein